MSPRIPFRVVQRPLVEVPGLGAALHFQEPPVLAAYFWELLGGQVLGQLQGLPPLLHVLPHVQGRTRVRALHEEFLRSGVIAVEQHDDMPGNEVLVLDVQDLLQRQDHAHVAGQAVERNSPLHLKVAQGSIGQLLCQLVVLQEGGALRRWAKLQQVHVGFELGLELLLAELPRGRTLDMLVGVQHGSVQAAVLQLVEEPPPGDGHWDGLHGTDPGHPVVVNAGTVHTN